MTADEHDPAEQQAAAATKPAAKKSAAKKSATTSTSAKKAATKKTPAKKTPAKKTPAPPPEPDDTATIEVTGVEVTAAMAAGAQVTGVETAPVDPTVSLDAATQEAGSTAAASRIARAKVVAEALKARGAEEYERLQERRQTSRTIDSAFCAAEHDQDVGGGILAAAVAFRLFLFMVPFVFVLVVVFGIGADAAGESSRSLASSAGAVGLLAKTFSSVAGKSFGGRLVALVIGSFALFLTTRSVIKVLRVTSGLTWDVPVPKLERPTRAVGIFLAVIIGALGLIQLIGVLDGISFIAGLIATALFILVPAGLWLLFSLRAFPHPEGAGWKAMLPGSLLVGVGLQLLHVFTVVWIAHQVDSKSETYGAIGIALALLFWAYLAGRVFMAGMVLNASRWYRDHERPDSEPEASMLEPTSEVGV